jgi:hypothetical protein
MNLSTNDQIARASMLGFDASEMTRREAYEAIALAETRLAAIEFPVGCKVRCENGAGEGVVEKVGINPTHSRGVLSPGILVKMSTGSKYWSHPRYFIPIP